MEFLGFYVSDSLIRRKALMVHERMLLSFSSMSVFEKNRSLIDLIVHICSLGVVP